MDYSFYANNKNPKDLRTQFENITQVLTDKLNEFRSQIFMPRQFYLFGFGFGGQIVIQAGRHFGRRNIHSIDGNLEC